MLFLFQPRVRLKVKKGLSELSKLFNLATSNFFSTSCHVLRPGFHREGHN